MHQKKVIIDDLSLSSQKNYKNGWCLLATFPNDHHLQTCKLIVCLLQLNNQTITFTR